MMKRNLILIAASMTATAMMSGCSVVTSTQSSGHESMIRVLEPEMMAVAAPLLADVETVGGRVSELIPVRMDQKILTAAALQEYTKNAIYEAARRHDADIIVAPSYEVNFDSDKATLTIRITGYPAVFRNFRTMTQQDMWMLRALDPKRYQDGSDTLLPESPMVLSMDK